MREEGIRKQKKNFRTLLQGMNAGSPAGRRGDWHFTVRKNVLIVVSVLLAFFALSMISLARFVRIGGETVDLFTDSLSLRDGNYIDDASLKNIGRLNNLTFLDLDGCTVRITDKSLWNRLSPSMTYLHLNNTGLADEDLKNIPFDSFLQLRSVEINDNPLIADLSPLRPVMPMLTEFKCSRTAVTDLSILEDCESLHWLEAEGLGIRDVPVLSGCEDLHTLCLGDNQIKSLQTMRGALRNVTSLYIDNNQLSDLVFLEDSLYLENLSARGNALTSVEPLRNCAELDEVDLRDNRLTDSSPLANSRMHLVKLYLGGNALTTLEDLYPMPELYYFDIAGNRVTDLSFLSASEKLILLSAPRNGLTEMPDLSGFTELRKVFLDGNVIAGAVTFASPTKIFALTLQHNQITSIELDAEISLLALYDNPMEQLTVSDTAKLVDVWIDYRESLAPLISKVFCSDLYLLGCPNEKRTALKKLWGEYAIRFPESAAEADAEMSTLYSDLP